MQIQDLYKLIHQAALGSEHAISDLEAPRQWLERELAEMGSGPEETLIDPISADGKIVRVHLRPFLAHGGDAGTLLSAFVRTANAFHGDKAVLQDYWNAATELRPFSSVEMIAFIETARAQDFPAVHHSPEYERLYRPAYRVIKRKYLDER
jgi:hypothetical protein